MDKTCYEGSTETQSGTSRSKIKTITSMTTANKAIECRSDDVTLGQLGS